MKIDVLEGESRLTGMICDDFAEIQIGRSPENDLVVPSEEISPFHALIRVDPFRITIEDSKSVNGVTVNGRRIGSKPVVLKENDSIILGRYNLALTGDFPVAHPPLSKKKPVAILSGLLLSVIGLLLAKLLGGDPAAKSGAGAIPPPQVVKMATAVHLLKQGEKEFYKNHIDQAAIYFRQAVDADSRVPFAQEFLNQIQADYMSLFLKNGYVSLKKGQLQEAEVSLNHLISIAPDDSDVIAFSELVTGQKKYDRVMNEVSQGDVANARPLLTDSRIYYDDKRKNLLEYVDKIDIYQSTIRQINEAANRMDVDGAIESANQGLAMADLPMSWQHNLEQMEMALLKIRNFQNALKKEDAYQVAMTGSFVLKDPMFVTWIGAVPHIKSQLDDYRQSLVPNIDSYWVSSKSAFEQVKQFQENGDFNRIGKVLKQAVEDLTVVHFANFELVKQQDLQAARNQLNDWIRLAYQSAYVLQENGRVREALAAYKIVLEATSFDSPYRQLAEPAYNRLLVISSNSVPVASSFDLTNIRNTQLMNR